MQLAVFLNLDLYDSIVFFHDVELTGGFSNALAEEKYFVL